MEAAILCRSMLEDLSIDEFTQFYESLLTTFNMRELLTKSIFHLLAYEARNHSSLHQYTECLQRVLTDIIESRPAYTSYQETAILDTTTNESDNVSLTHLSAPLIASCAAYLRLGEVTNFQLCCRHIYVSCKTQPFSVTRLFTRSIHWFDKYMKLDVGSQSARIEQLSRFSMAKKIKLYLLDFDRITDGGQKMHQFVWKNIKHLALSSMRMTSFKHGDHDGSMINKWLSTYGSLLSSQQNLQKLDLRLIASIPVSTFCKLVVINPNIRVLQLVQINGIFPDPVSGSDGLSQFPSTCELMKRYDFCGALPNLEGIVLEDICFENERRVVDALLMQLSEKLRCLHIILGDARNPNFYMMNPMMRPPRSLLQERGENEETDNYPLRRVQDLCVALRGNACAHQAMQPFRFLLQTVKDCRLQRVHISVPPRAPFGRWEDYRICITDLLQTHLSTLRYLAFSFDNGTAINALCNAILSNNQTQSRLTFTDGIQIEFKAFALGSVGWQQDYRRDIGDSLVRLIRVLIEELPSCDWCVKFQTPWTSQGVQFAKRLDALAPECDVYRYYVAVKTLRLERCIVSKKGSELLPDGMTWPCVACHTS